MSRMRLFNFGLKNGPIVIPPLGFGFFTGGRVAFSGTAADHSSYTDKFDFVTLVVTPGTTITLNRLDTTAVGNEDVAIVGGGFVFPGITTTNFTDKYTYVDDSTAPTTVLSYSPWKAAGIGVSTHGIFAGGKTIGGAVATSNKYTYSNDVVTVGTSLSLARGKSATTRTLTIGYIFDGDSNTSPVSRTDKYTYSGDSVTSGTALSPTRGGAASASGIGSSVFGIISGGDVGGGQAVNTSQKYIYSGDTTAAATSLTQSGTGVKGDTGSAECPLFGIFGGGFNTSTNALYNQTDKYTFSNDAVVISTVLGQARSGIGSTSSINSGL